MKMLKQMWNGVKLVLSFLGGLFFTEPVINLTMSIAFIAVLYFLGCVVYNAYDYWRNALSRATGWSTDNITLVTILVTVVPFWTIGIHFSLKTAHEEWKKDHPEPDMSLGKRFLRWSKIWALCFLAASILVSTMVTFGIH